eukprot:scpid106070/ scgid13737/ 
MPSYRFHSSLHSNDVVVSSDGREVTRLPSGTVPEPTQRAAVAVSQTQPAAKSQRDLQETVKKFTDAVSDKRRVMYEIWALVFNVLHLLHSTGAEKVRWTAPVYEGTFSYTLGVSRVLM